MLFWLKTPVLAKNSIFGHFRHFSQNGQKCQKPGFWSKMTKSQVLTVLSKTSVLADLAKNHGF
jgi:hypothetical protein